MKLMKYLATLLAIGLLCPTLLAQKDQPAPSAETPRREKADPGPRKDPPRDAGQKAKRGGEAIKKKVGDRAAIEAEQAKALRRAVQLKKKQAAGQELTPDERQEMRAIRAKLADQGRQVVREKRAAVAEKKGKAIDQPKRSEARKPAIREKKLEGKQVQGDAVRPAAKLKGQPEQAGRVEKARSDIRQRRADLNAKLAEARRQLQTAASEPRVNQGAIRERANRIGQLEAELAMLNSEAARGQRARR